ncbi:MULTISPECIES: TVP38/TMEM64 family protein [unclassified Nocardiopsis]|uniref:TVP38/TMEM64 family protein n=1 Tax=unclassified Nocardiopsis TaxID=2649073 RepID=UPI001357D41D|nr:MULTISPECIES: VTT domain-containing protein [unclassified Nocardiopsis]
MGTGHARAAAPRLALLALWAAVLVLALVRGPDPETLREWVEEAGAAAPLAYLCVYAAAVFALLPRPVLNAAAGLLFGWPWGLPLALVGGVCAALAQFWVARYVAGETVARLLPEGVRTRVDALEGGRALLAVLQLRLLPVVPYQAVNYGFGLTRMGAWPFAAGTLAGGVPATAALVLVGSGGADLGVPAAVGACVLAAVLGLAWWWHARRARA